MAANSPDSAASGPGGGTTSPEEQVFMFAKRGLVDDVEGIVAATGVDAVAATDALGNTCLHYAAQGGHTATVEWLLAAGADPNAPNVSGDSPLHKAAWGGHAAAAAVLLAAGADRYLANADGESPVKLAAGKPSADVLEEQLVVEDGDDDDDEAYSDSD
ncbi:uncharacterized protein AMSG_00196 [Thecamonas trahens ATCC 50062]|uniref:Uncharacterized protein n=1 Tax=Thecamonas trahens ATCC 50062 TaxID=461836 RepID=A0A0L0D465_THETB|nr:hypothetical protein AMSG_00196 [Thecamonas trahens ATCC 50062]KNC46078.1 hypothetical protein AMSG_00196 [Thecamonas trahens ATCC 50062]|eukprot:XP_013763058.1 hypothetical protein AMSG_00196 [Thecamonas trahens ATCC 50062]